MGKDKQQLHLLQQANMRQALVAGALSGVAVDSVLYPLGKEKLKLTLTDIPCILTSVK